MDRNQVSRWFGHHFAEIQESARADLFRVLDRGMERWRSRETRFHPADEASPPPVDLWSAGRVLGVPGWDKAFPVFKGELLPLAKGLELRLAEVGPLAFPTVFGIEASASQLLYVACRIIRPLTILETGVANGISSWHFLQALEHNRTGTLHSIDYPVLDRAMRQGIGRVVPENLRRRWTLHIGDSIRTMKGLGGLKFDVFLHDSEHSYLRMRDELRLAWDSLKPDGLLFCDDIGTNNAFHEFVASKPAGVRTARCGRMGIIRKPSEVESPG